MTDESNLITLTVEQPDEALFKQSSNLLVMAEGYIITTPEQALNAGEDLKEIKALKRQLEKKRTAITGPINKALREVNALFRPAKKWLDDAESFMKTKLLTYQREQDAIAQEAQRKADEKARKERERIEAKAAVARAEEEAARAAAAKAKTDEAKAAANALAEKQAKKVAKLEEKAEVVQAPVISTSAPEIEGVHTRSTWKATVTSTLAFIKYVVEEDNDLIGWINVDRAMINAWARETKGESILPGVEVREEKIIAARG